MKRIYSLSVLFLCILSFFSCTNNSVDEGKKDRVSQEIENNFAEFVKKRNNTNSNLKLKVQPVNLKKSYSDMGDSQTFNNFSTQVDVLLSKGLPLTYDAMKKNPTEYKSLLLSTSAMQIDNGDFYYRNPDYSQQDLIDVITDSRPSFGTKADGPCENEAINNAVSCYREADEAFAVSFVSAQYAFYSGNAVGAAITLSGAYYTHRKKMSSCVASFNREISGCK